MEQRAVAIRLGDVDHLLLDCKHPRAYHGSSSSESWYASSIRRSAGAWAVRAEARERPGRSGRSARSGGIAGGHGREAHIRQGRRSRARGDSHPARSSRKRSIPSNTARAYSDWPSATAARPPGPGIIMNIPSQSTAGIQVGRTSARSPRPTPRSRRPRSGPARARCPSPAHALRLVVEHARAVVAEGLDAVRQRVVVNRDQEFGVHAVRKMDARPEIHRVSVVRVISTSAPARTGGRGASGPPRGSHRPREAPLARSRPPADARDPRRSGGRPAGPGVDDRRSPDLQQQSLPAQCAR